MRHLADLQELRAAHDLDAAEAVLSTASARHTALPVPARDISAGELSASRDTLATAERVLDDIDREMQRAHGALEQVGGAVARERLRDALEAFDLAERQEREIEEDYEAWRLLLEQMKEADAAQANNLGQALAPADRGSLPRVDETALPGRAADRPPRHRGRTSSRGGSGARPDLGRNARAALDVVPHLPWGVPLYDHRPG